MEKSIVFYGETELPVVKLLENHFKCMEEEYHVMISFQEEEADSIRGRMAVNYENVSEEERKNIHPIMESLIPALLTYGQHEYIEQQIAPKKPVKREDALTGVFHREYLLNRADILKRAEIYPTAVIAVKVNGWKSLVKNHGAQMGDSMLQLTATVLRAEAERDYLIGRVAKDTFVVLIPLVREGEAEAYQTRVEEECRTYENSLFAHRISFGMEVTNSKDEDIREKIKTAAEMMGDAV